MTELSVQKTEGLHEIHISTDPEHIALLRLYCKDRKIKPILAVSLSGDYRNQLMISKFTNGTALEVIDKAFIIKKDMENYGLKVFRVKVEAMMNNKGCPKEDEKPIRMEDYWEFHLKLDIDNSTELKKLQNVAKKHGCGISYNVFKRELEPLITLRVYNRSYNQAMKLKAYLIEDIKLAGFVCNNGIQQEFSIFDTNIDMDKNWLPSINKWL